MPCDWLKGKTPFKRRFFLQTKRHFRTVFVSFSNRIVLCRFKRRSKEKRRSNGAFPFSQSQGIDKNAVYCFKRCSLSFILFTNQQPFQVKRFLTVNRLTNEQRCVNIVSLLDDILHKCCVSPKILKVSFL